MTTETLFKKHGLSLGRMISASKTHPKGCRCIWNANLISPSKGKIWYGDINLTKDGNALKEIAKAIGEPLYVLREMDARFGTEDDTVEELISRAVWSTDTDIVYEN